MRKIFLTSGLVLCMACPAFADLGPNNMVENAQGQETSTAAACKEPTLEGYSGTSTFTARWSPNNYTITYQDTNNDSFGTALYGSLSGSIPSAQTVAYDDTVNLTSMTGTRTGYTFSGWTGDKNVRALNGTDIPLTYNNAESITYIYPGDAILTAKWDPNKSGAITLISSVYPSNDTSQTATYTTSTTEAVTPATTSTLYSIYNNGLYKDYLHTTPMVASEEIPVKAGYTFNGFYDSGMTTEYITNVGVATDAGKRAVTTAGGTDQWYAKWTPIAYSVTYHPGTAKNGSITHTPSYPSGGTETVTNNPTYDSSYTIAYNHLGALGDGSSTTTPYYSQSGYTFTGWRANYNLGTGVATALTDSNTSGGTAYSAGDSVTYKVVGNVDMYAQWAPKKYQVNYYSSTVCGTFSPAANAEQVDTVNGVPIYRIIQDVNSNNALTYDAVYTPLSLADAGLTISTGYTFDGWSTLRNSPTVYDAIGQVLPAGQAMANPWTIDLGVDTGWTMLVLQAGCHPNTYDAIYKKGLHGTGSDYTHTDGVTYDSVYTTLAQATTGITENAGYTFRGWSQNENAVYGTDTIITAGSAMASAWTTDSDLTLYAIYSPNQYTITYSCGSKPGSESQSGSVPSSQSINQDGTYNLAANTCVYQGWHFTGWHCDHTLNETGQALIGNTVNYQPGDTGTFKSATNVECTAQWEANNIITTWNLDGGSATQNGLTSCTYDSTIGLPQGVSKTGYTFGGWTVVNSNSSNSGGGDNNGGGNGGGSGSGNGDSTPVVDNGPAI